MPNGVMHLAVWVVTEHKKLLIRLVTQEKQSKDTAQEEIRVGDGTNESAPDDFNRRVTVSKTRNTV